MPFHWLPSKKQETCLVIPNRYRDRKATVLRHDKPDVCHLAIDEVLPAKESRKSISIPIEPYPDKRCARRLFFAPVMHVWLRLVRIGILIIVIYLLFTIWLLKFYLPEKAPISKRKNSSMAGGGISHSEAAAFTSTDRSIPYFLIRFHTVTRLTPRIRDASDWLPPTCLSTSTSSSRSVESCPLPFP